MMSGFSVLAWRMLRGGRNGLNDLVNKQPTRALGILVVVGVVWLLIYGITAGVLGFLDRPRYVSLKPTLLRGVLALFFFALFFLAAMSVTVAVWGALFRTRSAKHQAMLPLNNGDLYWGAALEGGLWAGWALLVLAIPLVAALTPEASSPWLFVPASLLVLLAFQLCCMAAGAFGAIVLARAIPLLRRGVKGFLIVGLLVLVVIAVVAVGGADQGGEPVGFMREVIGRIAFARNPLLPPAWAQGAITAATESQWSVWGWNMLVMLTSAAGVAVLGETVARRRLRLDLDLLTGRPDDKGRSRSRGWRLSKIMPRDIALLVAKDLRLFLRDPAQLLQVGLFFGLLGFYILLLPRLGEAFMFEDWWRRAVSLLNLTAVSMALATFTGRFVYPLLSLEGRRLWVLVLAPWSRQRVVTAKFAFALAVGLPVSTVLVAFSGRMLELSDVTILYQAYVTVCIGMGLSACALGIGARLADYEEDNPAKLVSGFGGTMNLLASLAYVGLMLVGAALPLVDDRLGGWGWAAGIGWTTLVCVAWTWFCLHVARRWFASPV